MPITVNPRHLDDHSVHIEGEVPIRELDIDTRDEVIRIGGPLTYDLEVEMVDGGLLVQGSLRLPLDCQCVRCLNPIQHEVLIDNWTLSLPLEGEEAVPVVNDLVDLTPFVREDILLEFPQHPLCDTDCRGLLKPESRPETKSPEQNEQGSSAWAELNKLKL